MTQSLSKYTFRNISIRSKLIIYLMATSCIAVFLLSVMFYFLINKQLQDSYYKDVNNLLSILERNCEAALLFDVPEDAKNILNSLETRDSIVAAYILDTQDNLFASFEKRGPLNLLSQKEKGTFLKNAGYHKSTASIKSHDNTSVIGKIILYDNAQEITNNKKNALFLLGLGIFCTLFATLLIAHFLRNHISKPVQVLTKMVQDLAHGKFPPYDSFSATSSANDEIGILTNSFLSMGQQLQNSYMQLEEHSSTLEKNVRDRTKELHKVIEELKTSQVQLVQSEKMAGIGHLVTGIAHEINNNISFISNVLPLIELHLEKLQKYASTSGMLQNTTKNQVTEPISHIKKLLGNAFEGVHRTKKIIADLSSFARPSKGRVVHTDINREIEAVLTLIQYDIKGKIEIQKEFSPSLPLVPCARDQISQVYMNMLLNAIHAIKDEGVITIRTWCDKTMAYISFSDTGDGIPEENINSIFDPFFTTKDVGEGTGLGLSISYGIIQKHHGNIQVRNIEKKGAEFIVSLPLLMKEYKYAP